MMSTAIPQRTRGAGGLLPSAPVWWRVLLAEVFKIGLTRTLIWAVAAGFVATAGIAALAAWSINWASDPDTAAREGSLNGAGVLMGGAALGQLALALFGALAITREFGSGQIRSTLIAVPTRIPVLVAKTTTVLIGAWTVSMLALTVAWMISSSILDPYGLALPWDATVLRIIVTGGLATALLAVLGLGLGTIIRHSAGAVAAVVALLLILPGLVGLLPGDWADDVARFLPSRAAAQALAVAVPAGSPTPAGGVVIVLCWSVAAMAVASVLFTRRDA